MEDWEESEQLDALDGGGGRVGVIRGERISGGSGSGWSQRKKSWQWRRSQSQNRRTDVLLGGIGGNSEEELT